MMEIENDIKVYISSHLAPDISAEEIPSDYDLMANGVLNSLALVRLIAWLGKTYGLPINELNLAPADFRTVERISAFVTGNAAVASA